MTSLGTLKGAVDINWNNLEKKRNASFLNNFETGVDHISKFRFADTYKDQY